MDGGGVAVPVLRSSAPSDRQSAERLVGLATITIILLNLARLRPIGIKGCENGCAAAKGVASAGDDFRPHKPSVQKANQFALNPGCG